MIILEDVTKEYNKEKGVHHLTAEIKDGNIIGLVGPNGAGKTTTISMLMGILKKTSGKIEIDGMEMNEEAIDLKAKIGYVSDDENQLLSLKAIEYLNFIADMYRVSESERKSKIIELSERFEIEHELNQRMDKFSKGMKQKIMIMASILHSPKIWILDEPFSGLDPKMTHALKEFMKEYAAKGNTVILSSHALEIVENLCDEVLFIKHGTMIYKGTLDELKDKYPRLSTLEEIYLKVFE